MIRPMLSAILGVIKDVKTIIIAIKIIIVPAIAKPREFFLRNFNCFLSEFFNISSSIFFIGIFIIKPIIIAI